MFIANVLTTHKILQKAEASWLTSSKSVYYVRVAKKRRVLLLRDCTFLGTCNRASLWLYLKL